MRGKVVDIQGVERILNWTPSLPTLITPYTVPNVPRFTIAPPFLSLVKKMPPITDQGNQGACTGHSSVAPLYVAQVNAGRKQIVVPSPAFIYYNERLMDGTADQDSGANISDIYRAANKYGVAPEQLMPYVAADFTTPPSAAAYAAAGGIKAHVYAPVLQLKDNLIGCMHHGGFPVNFGISVYDSFMSDDAQRTGRIPMPAASENLLGAHAIDLVGYNETDAEQDGVPPLCFIFRNSWGTAWGAQGGTAGGGYGFLPFDYVLSPQLATDFWMIRAL